MKQPLTHAILALLIIALSTACPAWGAGLLDAVKGVANSAGVSTSGKPNAATGDPNSAQTANGLKEALTIGVEKAVELTGKTDGYFKNDAIKIVLPEQLDKVDQVLRQMGGDQLSDMLIEKMNRAAEAAAPQAKSIFVDAIADLQFQDVTKLMGGKDDAATEYLKNKTGPQLKSAFLPQIKESMESVGAIKVYNEYVGAYSENPLAKMLGVKLDINDYVTDQAVEGLFTMVAEQETKIRENPAARTTELLQAVFGN